MRTARPLLLTCLSACGSNPPCTECPDISGSYRLTYQSVPAEKSTCGRFRVEGSEEDLVVEQEGSRVVLQPDGREGTLHRDLTLRFPYRESETTKGIRTATRHRLSGRIELEPSVRFTGEMDMEVRQDSCSLSVPVSW